MLIKELVQLMEDVTGPLDVADLVANFPNRYKKAISDQWGKDRLSFKGLSFFANDGIYDQLNTAVSKFAGTRMFDGIQVEMESVSEYKGKTITLDYADREDPTQYGQECYMGFSPKANKLLVAYDTSLREDEFNEQFDDAWKSTFGRRDEFDSENSEHAAVYDDLWDKFKDARVYVVFEVDVSGKSVKIVRQVDLPFDLKKGFYSHGRSLLKQEYPDIIDLRLD